MHIKIPGTAIIITTRKALAVAEAIGGHLLEDALVAARKTEVGKAAASIVADLENSALTGPERRAKAIGDLAPFLVGYIARGGMSAAIADVETFAGQLVESVLADVRSTATIARIATAVLQVARAG